MIPRPVSYTLLPKQQEAVNGPYGPEMLTFICGACNNKFYDMKHYFYGVASTTCLWCTKFPERNAKKLYS